MALITPPPQPSSFSPPPPPLQESEHAFWMDFERGRAVCVPAPPPPYKTSKAKSYGTSAEGAAVLLNRYWGLLDPPAGFDDGSGGKGVGGPLSSRRPRPESYREDVESASGVCACGNPTVTKAQEAVGGVGGRGGGGGGMGIGVGPYGACHELAAAAESGWDFSSRWAGIRSRGDRMTSCEMFSEDGRGLSGPSYERRASGEEKVEGGRKGERFCVCDTATTAVVPVDLNAFLHRTELNIARLHHALLGSRSHLPSSLSSSAPSLGRPCTPASNSPAGAAYSRGRFAKSGAARTAENASGAAGGGAMPPPPPAHTEAALLTLDEIQRRYLAYRRNHTDSLSASSGTLVAALARQDSAGDGDVVASEALGRGEARPLCRKSILFAAAAHARSKAMEQTMWDGKASLWRDLLLPTGEVAGSRPVSALAYICP